MAKDDGRKFNLKERAASFVNAFSGIATMIRHEHNFRIHMIILPVVVICGIVLRISATDWALMVIVSGMVLSAECFNTAIEYLSDQVSAEYNERIKKIKDVAAAGVLITAIIAIITGLIIFVPAIVQLIK